MARYRKKPIVIDAWQSFNNAGSYTTLWPRWIMDALLSGVIYSDGPDNKIKTPNGDMLVGDGDWIIKDVKGELYACKADIFDMTYEEVE